MAEGALTDLETEVRAGVTTFMVMALCLTAGVLSIAMGLVSNYPFALAPGMGLNAVVAFELVAGRGLTWPQAMYLRRHQAAQRAGSARALDGVRGLRGVRRLLRALPVVERALGG